MDSVTGSAHFRACFGFGTRGKIDQVEVIFGSEFANDVVIIINVSGAVIKSILSGNIVIVIGTYFMTRHEYDVNIIRKHFFNHPAIVTLICAQRNKGLFCAEHNSLIVHAEHHYDDVGIKVKYVGFYASSRVICRVSTDTCINNTCTKFTAEHFYPSGKSGYTVTKSNNFFADKWAANRSVADCINFYIGIEGGTITVCYCRNGNTVCVTDNEL